MYVCVRTTLERNFITVSWDMCSDIGSERSKWNSVVCRGCKEKSSYMYVHLHIKWMQPSLKQKQLTWYFPHLTGIEGFTITKNFLKCVNNTIPEEVGYSLSIQLQINILYKVCECFKYPIKYLIIIIILSSLSCWLFVQNFCFGIHIILFPSCISYYYDFTSVCSNYILSLVTNKR